MLTKQTCRSRPFIYRIDPCTACNIQCPGCESHTQKTTSNRLLSFQDFQYIVDRVKRYCIRISLYDTGEPLMNKNIYKMIGYASDNRISTSISTNLLLFEKEKHINALFQSRLTVIQPDLDGISQKTYSMYRVGGDVSTVKKGIEAIVLHKKQTGSKYPSVEPQVIMFKHLSHEKTAINDYLRKVGVDRIFWKEDYGFNPEKMTDRNITHLKSRKCFWLYLGVMIRPDGNVYPCSGKGLNRFPYGNILTQSIHDIWNNKFYQFSRKLFTKGSPLEYNAEMEQLPCHACTSFQKTREMLPKTITEKSVNNNPWRG